MGFDCVGSGSRHVKEDVVDMDMDMDLRREGSVDGWDGCGTVVG